MKIEIHKTWIYDSDDILEEIDEKSLPIEELEDIAREWSEEDQEDFYDIQVGS